MRFPLSLALVVLVAGCGNRAFIERPLDAEPSPPPKEEIVVWHTYSDEETRVFERDVITAFERTHPRIKVTAVRQPYSSELKSTLVARSTAAKIPDLVRVDVSWVPSLSELGVLTPLDSFADYVEVLRPLHAVSLQTGEWNGRYYGLPVNLTTKIAIYNREKLHALGLASPPATLRELLDRAEAAHQKIGMDGLTTWSVLPYFYSLGGKLLDPANEHSEGYLNSPGSVKAMQRIVDLIDSGVFNSDLIFGRGDRWNGVLKGDYLMIDDGPWFFSIQATSEEAVGKLAETAEAVPFPGPSIVGGENMVILKGTKHREAAWTFLKWMAGVPAQTLLFKAGLIPTNSEVPIPLEVKDNPFIMATVKGLENPFLRPPISRLERLESIFEAAMLQIFTHKVTVEQGLNDAARRMEKILADSKPVPDE